ncbi:MAG TPA: nucleotide exchange factor GrpE [Pyrinomonadaceae bacterium]
MIDKDRQQPNRIPVRFVDEEQPRADAPGGKTADELGRESSYDDETEMQQRIESGGDEAPTEGGGPRHEDLPERREDQDTNPRSAQASAGDGAGGTDMGDDAAVEIDADVMALATEAELLAAQEEVRALQAELVRARAERQELREVLARRQADFENSRKRMERERVESYQRIVADVVAQLLPVIDNLRRAVDAEASAEATESEEFRHFLNGVSLIGKQLDGVLERLGVEQIPTVGQPFDPHIHEAIATEPSGEHAPDTVAQEVQRGYRLGDRLIRPAMVKVATRQ